MFFRKPGKSQHTDAELVDLYKKEADLQYLGELYQRYMSMVYGVCLKYLSDREESKDAVMQIFEKLVTTIHKHEVSSFKSWIYVIAKNHCLMHLRTQKSKEMARESLEIMENTHTLHHDEEEGRVLEENMVKLENCIKTLQQEQKVCIDLFYLQKKCYKEIEEITNYDLKKVKSYIQNGRRNLKICMENSK